ncbi:2-isopropylmalate synthase [Megalodesulfovibrio gigas]|uniref:2-isopropylmalate synthase n=1 Tax=Megalodesulfovibrio gigas (strain ATCC 19364 / DSM 1382 / NCIMB 9332 / VKM B-1759) TaxID=1121448 RepID=T2GF89_MEGG1|nr:2-isopropylmalate synthase [Megalodesulfovibrio gigas]AGW14963.1 putative 2-isopropylmalate synthase [Megalodesulfovibrio gigas DSM 1382 = ATCC 19364]
MSNRVIIFDTTLRDGEQSPGATMNQQEKIRLAKQLEGMGVDVIEAGFPAASKGDFQAVQAIAAAVKDSQIAGLARAIQPDIDRAWEAIKDAAHPRIHTFIATSPIHMEKKLRKAPDQVVEMAIAAVRHAAQYTANVEFSAEDASRSEPPFLARICAEVIKAGARTINIPDTVGYAQPQEFGELIAYLLEHVPGSEKVVWSVHCHNDLGLAAANTLAALKAGARQAEVTVSGIGERAGNAALEEVIMALRTRQPYFQLETGIRTEQLFPTCRLLSMIIGAPIPPYKAIVGANAFAHESGIHQDGMLKDSRTYEIMTPEAVGRTRTELVLGKHSGRNALGTKCRELGFTLSDEQLGIVFEAIKKLADKKEQIFDEDVEAVVLEEVFRIPDKYRLRNLTVVAGVDPPSAALVLEMDGREIREATFGVGPVDAAFSAINKAVGKSPVLEHYQVNAVTSGTDAQAEVMVRLRMDAHAAVGRGADGDVIKAGAKAYLNALNRLAKKEEERQCVTL